MNIGAILTLLILVLAGAIVLIGGILITNREDLRDEEL
jgi:hypothetical protein